MEPVRVSEANHRRVADSTPSHGTVKKRTSRRDDLWPMGAIAPTRGTMPRHDLDTPSPPVPIGGRPRAPRRPRGRLRPALPARPRRRPRARRRPRRPRPPPRRPSAPAGPSSSAAPATRASSRAVRRTVDGAARRGQPGRERPQRRHVRRDRGARSRSSAASRSTARSQRGVVRPRRPGRVHRRRASTRTTPRRWSTARSACYKELRPDARGRVAARPVHRAAHEPGRRALRRRRPSTCTWSPRRARSARPRRSPTPTSTTHALQDQAFDLRDVMGDATDQGDRALARTALDRGRRDAADVALGAAAPDPGRAGRGRRRRRPGVRRPRWTSCRRSSRTRSCSRTRSGLHVSLGQFMSSGGFAGVDALFANPPESTEQVLHPEKLRRARGAGRRRVPRRPGRAPGRRLERVAPGHVRRVPAARSCWPTRRRRRRPPRPPRRLGRRPRRADRRAGRRDGRSCSTPAWDTDADAGEFATALGRHRRRGSRPRAAARRCSRPEPNRVVLISANSDDTLGRVANVLGLAG